ncbi:FUSC family protein [Photobacterium sp. DNB22_13_2]
MFKLNAASKEALKVAIAFTFSIALAIAFGWEKPYWAAITVVVVAANDNYNTAIKHGRNRLLGTVLGIVYAVLTVHFFAQDREFFILSLLGFSAFCVYMSGCERYGYAFKMAFTVGVIIAAMGQFNNTATFGFAVLRIQETMLGVLVYSVVFQVIWPKNTETFLISQIQQEIDSQIKQTQSQLAALYLGQSPVSSGFDISRSENLKQLVTQAINDSPRIYSEGMTWRKSVAYLTDNKELQPCQTTEEKANELKHHYGVLKAFRHSLLSGDMKYISEIEAVSNMKPVSIRTTFFAKVKRSLCHDYSKRIIYVLRAQATLITSYAMWIYLPTPAGILFPLIASSLVNALYDVPSMYFKYTFIGILIFSAVILLEFIFLMPAFTEIYELATFYFINIFVIWKLFSSPQLSVLRVLGGNLLVVMTMSAMYLSPVYTITQSLNTLIFIFIILAIVRFYTLLTEEISSSLKFEAA